MPRRRSEAALYYLFSKRWLGNFHMESPPLTAQETLARMERASQKAPDVEVRDEDGRTFSLEELRKLAAKRP
jgi:hypothetical protein